MFYNPGQTNAGADVNQMLAIFSFYSVCLLADRGILGRGLRKVMLGTFAANGDDYGRSLTT